MVNDFLVPMKTTNLDFGQALAAMRAGKIVRRDEPDQAHLRIVRVGNIEHLQWRWRTPEWHRRESLFDCAILATDWRIVKEEKA